MIICLDVGNTHIYGGIIDPSGEIVRCFRYETKGVGASDQFGIFVRTFLQIHNIPHEEISDIAISSVVPKVNYSISSACQKYFSVTPYFLSFSDSLPIEIKTRNPSQVGADLLAAAIAASQQHPKQNTIIVDFGTATTISALSKDAEYLGVIIMPGFKLSMESLTEKAAQLPPVELIAPTETIGKSTVESIQSGLYFNQLGAVQELKSRISREYFNNEPYITIGTGGFVGLFQNEEELFDHIERDMVLTGLYFAFSQNRPSLTQRALTIFGGT